jgi:hypothetical protein
VTAQPRVQILKCWPESFRALSSGAKKHEVRKDDRGFMVGDYLRLDEWEPHRVAHKYPSHEPWEHYGRDAEGAFTGESLWFLVTYKSAPGTWGLPADVCVLSIVPCDEPKPVVLQPVVVP